MHWFRVQKTGVNYTNKHAVFQASLALTQRGRSIKLIVSFVTLHLVSGISPLCVNLILIPVPPFSNHLFIHPSLLPLLITTLLPLSFTPGLKPTCLTNPTPVVSLLHLGLTSRTFVQTVSSELPVIGFCF